MTKEFGACMQLLSRLSLPRWMTPDKAPDFTTCVRFFPLAGLVIALPATFVMALATVAGFSTMLTAALAMATQVAVTGALHEDGLADCADGFGGGRERAEKLAIMKDSRVGTFGVIGLVLALLVRFSALTALLAGELGPALAAYLAAHVASRALQVAFWHSLPPARDHGLSHGLGLPGAYATGLALSFGSAGAFLLTLPAFDIRNVMIAALSAVAVYVFFRRLCKAQIGGQTGDTIGALHILTEIAILAGLSTLLP